MYENTVLDEPEVASIVAIRETESKQELARNAAALGAIGIKRIVFDDPGLAVRWMSRVAARREWQQSLCCTPARAESCRVRESCRTAPLSLERLG